VAKSNSRGPPGWRPLRSDSSREGQTGMLDHLSNGHKTLKVRLNLTGDYQARVHQIKWFSWYSGREAGPHEQWPKILK
jgi:hypothetical protein